jgi:hypothetical protein
MTPVEIKLRALYLETEGLRGLISDRNHPIERIQEILAEVWRDEVESPLH